MMVGQRKTMLLHDTAGGKVYLLERQKPKHQKRKRKRLTEGEEDDCEEEERKDDSYKPIIILGSDTMRS